MKLSEFMALASRIDQVCKGVKHLPDVSTWEDKNPAAVMMQAAMELAAKAGYTLQFEDGAVLTIDEIDRRMPEG